MIDSTYTLLKHWILDPTHMRRRQAIQDFIKDENVPFEQRLEIFLQTPEHLQSYGDSILELEDWEKKYPGEDYYDRDQDYYRGHTITFMEIFESAFESDDEDIAKNGKLDENEPFSYRVYAYVLRTPKIRDMAANAMKLGFHGFVFDW